MGLFKVRLQQKTKKYEYTATAFLIGKFVNNLISLVPITIMKALTKSKFFFVFKQTPTYPEIIRCL